MCPIRAGARPVHVRVHVRIHDYLPSLAGSSGLRAEFFCELAEGVTDHHLDRSRSRAPDSAPAETALLQLPAIRPELGGNGGDGERRRRLGAAAHVEERPSNRNTLQTFVAAPGPSAVGPMRSPHDHQDASPSTTIVSVRTAASGLVTSNDGRW